MFFAIFFKHVLHGTEAAVVLLRGIQYAFKQLRTAAGLPEYGGGGRRQNK